MEQPEKANLSFEKCCKRSFYKGQSAFARALDTILFNILRFFALYFILRQWLRDRGLCIFLAIILNAILFFVLKIIAENRFEKHIEKLKTDTEKELIKQKLILTETVNYENTVKRLFKADCIILHSAERVSADKVYEAVREGIRKGKKALTIISIEPFSDSAAEAADRLKEYEPKLILAGELAGIRDAMRISDKEIEAAVMQKYGKQKHRRIDFSQALLPDRAKKYFSTGLMLLLLSFIMSYGIYIRFFSSLAFTAAGFVFFGDIAKKHKNSDKA